MKRGILLNGVILLMFSFCLNSCATGSEINPLVTEGENLFKANCLGCHPTDPGKPRVGPDLVGLGVSIQTTGKDAADYLEEAIREPGRVISPGFQDLMPSADVLGLDEGEIKALAAYLIELE